MMKRMTDFITPICEKSQILIRPQDLEETVASLGYKNNIPISECQKLINILKYSILNCSKLSNKKTYVFFPPQVLIWWRVKASLKRGSKHLSNRMLSSLMARCLLF